MLKVGITGKIASGKSAVEKILRTLGYIVLDLDEVSHYLLEVNPTKDMVIAEFGTNDRRALSQVVFSNASKRKILEGIIHPYMYDFILDFFKKNENEKMIFVSGALIYEAGFDKLFDKMIYVEAPALLRYVRLMNRNSLSEDEAWRRINSQNAIHELKADAIIENTETLFELNKKVENALSKILD